MNTPLNDSSQIYHVGHDSYVEKRTRVAPVHKERRSRQFLPQSATSFLEHNQPNRSRALDHATAHGTTTEGDTIAGCLPAAHDTRDALPKASSRSSRHRLA